MTEFKGKTEKDLKKVLFEKRDALRGFKFSTSGAKAKNVKEGKNLKKDIARILTELNSAKKAEIKK